MQWFQWMGVVGGSLLVVAFWMFISEQVENRVNRINKKGEAK